MPILLCSACGYEVPDTNLFCGKCGAKIEAPPPAAEPDSRTIIVPGKPPLAEPPAPSYAPPGNAAPAPPHCSGCGAPIESSQKFCTICGGLVAEPPAAPVASGGHFCGFCGAGVDLSQAFCMACGRPRGNVPAAPPPAPPAYVPAPAPPPPAYAPAWPPPPPPPAPLGISANPLVILGGGLVAYGFFAQPYFSADPTTGFNIAQAIQALSGFLGTSIPAFVLYLYWGPLFSSVIGLLGHFVFGWKRTGLVQQVCGLAAFVPLIAMAWGILAPGIQGGNLAQTLQAIKWDEVLKIPGTGLWMTLGGGVVQYWAGTLMNQGAKKTR